MTEHTKKSPQVITFGCRLNTYESQVIKNLASQAGLEDSIIINTCAVTSEAERQARQTIRKLKRQNPDANIIVTGCASQISPEKYALMPEVSRIIGNDEKMKLESYLSTHSHERILVNDIMSVKETAGHLVTGFDGKARAFVQVQNGCDHRCTFCIIPFGRGKSRSVAIGEIVNQIRHLIEKGYEEIVFTGVDITAYGADLPGSPSLGQMIKRVFALLPDFKRLRLSSLDPVEIDEDLWRLIGEESRLLPHLHLSLQAGDDLILKRMKRRHLRQDVLNFCSKARQLRSDVVFGADLIAGFPTETADMFENTRKIVEEADLTFLHVFPYSSRPGTPASRMPQVSGMLIKERAACLREEGRKAQQRFFSRQVHSTTQVLIESTDDQFSYGKTDHFAPISLPLLPHHKIGSLVTAKIKSYTDQFLQGE